MPPTRPDDDARGEPGSFDDLRSEERAPAPEPPPGLPGLISDTADDEALDAFVDAYDAHPVAAEDLARQHVTAVMVCHDGERWSRRSLAALAHSARPVDAVVAVDTGSTDATRSGLVELLGEHGVVTADAHTGFGAAVQVGLARADELAAARPARPADTTGTGEQHPRTEWVWLLHDDAAPDATALTRLLESALRDPSAAVIGPKIRGWSAPRQLLEVGLTITGGGRRHTGLERRELDQGQHDGVRRVLAVGSPGMLVRRDVWDELGGYDPDLPMFRDDIDFGWRATMAGHTVLVSPDAVVYHAEAAAHGRRRVQAARGRAHLVDRRHAMFVLLANAPARLLPLVVLRVLLGGLGRSVGYLVGKQPALALEELAATGAVLLRPLRLARARARRRPLRRVPWSEVRALLPPPGHTARTGVETVYGLLQGTGSASDLATTRRRAAGLDPDADVEPEDPWLVRFIRRPAVLLVLGAVVLALLASRGLYGAGRLAGGALLPAPLSPGDLWTTYSEAWHGVGLGSATAAPPYLAVVALLGTVLFSPSLAVDVLVLGSVPLAALTAVLLLRRLVVHRGVVVWGAAAYASLPVLTGAIAAGRLGTAVVCALLPLIVLAARRTLGLPASSGRSARPGPFRAAWSTGLLLAVAAAFVPLTWLLAVVLGVVALAVYRSRAALGRVLAVLVVAPLLLSPWTFEVLDRPVLLLTEAGVPGPGLSDPELPAWSVLALDPGGPGTLPVAIGAGLVLAAVVGLLLARRRAVVLSAWGVVVLGLVSGIAVSRAAVTGPTLETQVSGWPGLSVVLIGGAAVLAAALAADDHWSTPTADRSAASRPLVAVTAVLAVLVPVVAAGWWVVRGADDPLDRRNPAVLPVYVAEQAAGPDRIRTLVLDRSDDRIAYALLRQSGPLLGEAETGPEFGSDEPLALLVGDLAAGLGTVEGADIAAFGARYVYLPAPFDAQIAESLDAVPGLVRASPPEGAAMWRVAEGAARVRVLPPDAAELTGDGPAPTATDEAPWQTLDSEAVDVDTRIGSGADGRVVVLAESADPGWSATLDGDPLDTVTVDGWAQGFALPEAGGRLQITHESEARSWWLRGQVVVALLAIVLALPSTRRRRDAVDGVADLDADDATTTPGFLKPERLVGVGEPDSTVDPGARPTRRAPYRGRRARREESS